MPSPGAMSGSGSGGGGGGGGGAAAGGAGAGGHAGSSTGSVSGGKARLYRERPERPRLGRTHTSSPGILGMAAMDQVTGHHGLDLMSSVAGDGMATSMPRTLPIGTVLDDGVNSVVVVAPTASQILLGEDDDDDDDFNHLATAAAAKRAKKKAIADGTIPPPPPAARALGGVPPINVLVVEDNPINLKLLEAFLKRLKVRWKTAVNGRDAVQKWRGGGFHLVLMDIQLPVMNGLNATREIRRLERVNSIGMFSPLPNAEDGIPVMQPLTVPGDDNGSGSDVTATSSKDAPISAADRLSETRQFNKPVIIVALTASSLQSDRHEALAAGCNDFLTKVSLAEIVVVVVVVEVVVVVVVVVVWVWSRLL